MITRLDEIGKDLKESNKEIDFSTNLLIKANSKVEKINFDGIFGTPSNEFYCQTQSYHTIRSFNIHMYLNDNYM